MNRSFEVYDNARGSLVSANAGVHSKNPIPPNFDMKSGGTMLMVPGGVPSLPIIYDEPVGTSHININYPKPPQ